MGWKRTQTPISIAFTAMLALSLPSFAECLESDATVSRPAAVEVASGLRVYVDPATGEITSSPTRAQIEALDRQLEDESREAPQELRRFDLRRGGQGLFLNGSFQSALIVQRSGDGNLVFSCVDGDHAREPSEPTAPETEWAVR